MNVIRTKPGVEFSIIAPAGFAILSALWKVSQKLGLDLEITSGTDGCHSGQHDPHHRGEAYDVRTHDFTDAQKKAILDEMMRILTFDLFYGFLESFGTDNEHLHFQVKKGTTYP